MRKATQLFFIIMLFSAISVFAQRYTISGTVKDAVSGEALVGASVAIPSLSTGNMAGGDGSYKIENIPAGTYEFVVTYLGYSKLAKNVKVDGNVKVDFKLEPTGVLLQETVVKGTQATLRETPVAFSQVSGKDLEMRLASRDIPFELVLTPSVFASVSGGGAGDATMFIRGYSQRNVAVMINGVPVNDMENKWVYWSDFDGLGDVTDNVQIQRGLGASPYSVNAIGGLLNIQTAGVGSIDNFYKVKQEWGSNNLQKLSGAFSQKVLGNLTVTGYLARKTWDGFAVSTYDHEWQWYFAIGGVWGNHSIELQVFDSPQEHGQRPSYARLPVNTIYNTNGTVKQYGWNQMGQDFNYSVGRYNNGWFNEATNKYDQPTINLNWNWAIAKNSTLSTVFYYSMGRGWGSGTLGAYAPGIVGGAFNNYRNYDAVYATNYAKGTINQSGYTSIRVNINGHDWWGVLSTFKQKFSDEFTMTLGFDGRIYTGEHWQEIKDLIGATGITDTYDLNNPSRVLQVGDNSQYHYESHIRQLGGFAQGELKTGSFTAFASVSASTTGYKRLDYFQFLSSDPNRESAWQNFFGITTKAGINYNLDDFNSVFVNGGFFMTPPVLTNVFVGYNTPACNNVYKDTKDETIYTGEVGYLHSEKDLTFAANAFVAQWLDRAFTSTIASGGVNYYYNIRGAKQINYGAEIEGAYRPLTGLEFKAAGSWIVGKYQNDVNATVSDDNGNYIKSIYAYVDGLYVSEFPQWQASVQLRYSFNIANGVTAYINPIFRFNGSQYSYFNPDTRTTATDKTQSWMIPDYSIWDLHAGANWYITDSWIKNVNLGIHVFNVLNNTDYIVESVDANYAYTDNVKYHNKDCAAVFYGFPISWNMSLSIGF